jgi:NADPH2:quinone reductase
VRAWQVRGHGEPEAALGLADVEVPVPDAGQVRIAVAASGIGLPDVLMCRGTYPLTPALPFTPGQEVAGTVTAVGPEVEGVAVGERVLAVTAFPTGHGGFAEEALAYGRSTFAVPAGLTDEQAAGFWISFHTAWIGLVERGGLAGGERLVVLGAGGGSGLAAVQLGRVLRARVTAVVGDERRAALALDAGAHDVVDHRTGDLLELLRAGGPVDVVYDPVGGAPAAVAARALGRGGRLLAVGFASGSWPAVDAHVLVRANASLVGVFAGGHDRAELEAIHAALAGLLADGSLRPPAPVVHAFGHLPAALRAVADREVVGKSVLLAPG